MIKREGYQARALFLFCTALGCAASAFGQAKIDTSLPEAPLPHHRVLHIFPGYETVQDPNIPVAPLPPRQKFEIAYRKVLDPSFLVEAGILAGFDQGVNYGPKYGQGWGPFAQRYGYNAANLASTYLFTDALLPIVFHADPRFFRKGHGSFASRVWWDVRSEAVSYNDEGRQVPNYSSILGFGMSTALSNAYSPDSSITFGKTMERFGVKEGTSVALNLLREFGGLSRPEKHQ